MRTRLDSERLKKALARACQKRGWNCLEVSKRAEVDKGHTSRLLRGKFTRLSRQLHAICNVLEVQPEHFLRERIDQWPTVENSVRSFVGTSKPRAKLLMEILSFLKAVGR